MTRETNCLATAIRQAIETNPERAVMREGDTVISGARCLAMAAARQRQLADAGVRSSDCVLVCNGRGVRYWIDLIAVWAAGAIAVPFDTRMDANRAGAIIANTSPVAVILGDSDDTFSTGLPAIVGEPEGEANGTLEIADKRSNETAAILFTSGSTGAPKGVTETHAALLGNAWSTLDVLELTPADRLVMATPFVFISAFSHFLVCILAGCEFIATEQKLFKGDLAARIRDSRANWFGGSPLQVRWIGEVAQNFDFPDLRFLMSSGDHLGVDVITLIRRTLPQVALFTVYGMTELAGRFCVLAPADLDRASGAVGRPIKGLTVEILDEVTGSPLAQGELGEVTVRGRFVFPGYHNDPKTTGDSLRNGRFHTGDLGHIGEDGFLRLQGRKDDVFKYGGQKVSALPIAEALMRTGSFEDVAVAGVPDKTHGGVPFVFYTSKNRQPVDTRAVMLDIRTQLPKSHMPVGFRQVDEIPRTGSGKVFRSWLREKVQEILQERSGEETVTKGSAS
tara:strand:+ start:626 stop:2149 length:1524 start_codon:yes stop_codon:yes gene_type:complete